MAGLRRGDVNRSFKTAVFLSDPPSSLNSHFSFTPLAAQYVVYYFDGIFTKIAVANIQKFSKMLDIIIMMEKLDDFL